MDSIDILAGIALYHHGPATYLQPIAAGAGVDLTHSDACPYQVQFFVFTTSAAANCERKDIHTADRTTEHARTAIILTSVVPSSSKRNKLAYLQSTQMVWQSSIEGPNWYLTMLTVNQLKQSFEVYLRSSTVFVLT